MPHLESMPMGWAKLQQTACLVEIIHLCMIIETQRDTTTLFRKIKHLACDAFEQYYPKDRDIICSQTMKDSHVVEFQTKQRMLAASLNNRAVLNGPKIEEQVLWKRVDPNTRKEV